MDKPSLESKEFWKERWQTQQTPWDLKKPHHLLSELFDLALSKTNFTKDARIYVPGCGRAHEAAWFAEQGLQVTGADYVPEAIDEAKRTYGHLTNLQLKVEDVFSIPPGEQKKYDAVIDRAMFCALDPVKRARYIQACHERLKSGGLFLGILFKEINHDEREGPPFSVNCEEFQKIIHPQFELLACEERSGKSGIEFISSEILVVCRMSDSKNK